MLPERKPLFLRKSSARERARDAPILHLRNDAGYVGVHVCRLGLMDAVDCSHGLFDTWDLGNESGG